MKNEFFSAKGSFRKLSSTLVAIEFALSADLPLECDRCASEYMYRLDEKMSLKVSDGGYEGESLDVIECFDHFVDFDSVISGEIEAIRSDYHYCEKCNKTSGE